MSMLNNVIAVSRTALKTVIAPHNTVLICVIVDTKPDHFQKNSREQPCPLT
ncbi:MAG TPA: hypothetical protein VFT31_08165 [Kribbella sp.]|nr:hypothetical protein [Kribbella sp.]